MSAHTPTPGWRSTLPQPFLGQCSLRTLTFVSSDLTSEGPSEEYGIVVGRGRDDWTARAARSACWEGWDMFRGQEGREGRLDSETERGRRRRNKARKKIESHVAPSWSFGVLLLLLNRRKWPPPLPPRDAFPAACSLQVNLLIDD